MKSVAALCFVLVVCSSHQARAQRQVLPPVDFSAMTCEQFWEKTTPSDRGPFLFWLSGSFGTQEQLRRAGSHWLHRKDQGPVAILLQTAQR